MFSKYTKKLLTPYINDVGYWTVSIRTNDNKRANKGLHQLLAITFIPNPNNLPEINHIDSNKLNWHLDNLEWITGSNNIRHAFLNNLCSTTASCDYTLLDEFAQRLLTEPDTNYSTLAKELNISDPATIRKLLKRHLERQNKHDLFQQITDSVRYKCRTNKQVLIVYADGSQEVFDSQRAVATALGTNPSAVCLALKTTNTLLGHKIYHVKTTEK